MATSTEIVDRAANDLGILRLGQSLQAQDSTRITSGYTEVYARLKKEALATWASTGEVPDEIVQHVVALVAENCLNTYGPSPERYKRIKLEAQQALREIRKFVANDFISQDSPRDF